MIGTEREYRYADEVQHHRRHIEHVVGPIAPAREESVKVTEHFFGPEIDAAFPGIALRQLNHGNALRPEKEKQRNQPQPDRNPSIGCDPRHYIQRSEEHTSELQ